AAASCARAWCALNARSTAMQRMERPTVRTPSAPCISAWLEAKGSTDGYSAGVFIQSAVAVTPRRFELIEFRFQGQVVIDTVEERNTTSFEVGSRTQSVAIILGLTVGQCHAVLAEAVGALEQVAIAVNFPQL